MLETIAIDLKIKYPLVDCIKSGARVDDCLEQLEKYIQHGLRPSPLCEGITVGQQLVPDGLCKYRCDLAQLEAEMELLSAGCDMHGNLWRRPRLERTSPSPLRVSGTGSRTS